MYEPTEGLSEQQSQKVIGGETAIWTEIVNIATIESLVFPRAFAVGEVLWGVKERDWEDAFYRIDYFSRLVTARGFSIGSIFPPYCKEGGCAKIII